MLTMYTLLVYDVYMIKLTKTRNGFDVQPMTEKAARFLNTFVGRTVRMTAKEWESASMEMSAHGCWVMGQCRKVYCSGVVTNRCERDKGHAGPCYGNAL